jgi:two-component system nitrate/nitrite response regulator NarL
MPRILLYTDQPILAKGLESLLRETPGFDLVAHCSTIQALLEQLPEDKADVALLDLTPEITFAVLSALKQAAPVCKLVLWVNDISTELAFQAVGLGLKGILRKTLAGDLQIKCLAKIYSGELWFEKALTDAFFAARRVPLTRREGQLVSLLAQGCKNKEIATALAISEGTVKVYLSRLFQKLGVKDRFELALFGLKNLNTILGPTADKRASAEAFTGLHSLVLQGATANPPGKPSPYGFKM